MSLILRLTSLILLGVFLFTGCSSSGITPPSEQEVRQEKIRLLVAENLKESFYRFDESHILHLKAGRFNLYQGVLKAPVMYGKVFYNEGKLSFIGQKEVDYTVEDINQTVLHLKGDKKELTLVKLDYTPTCYQPKNLFEAVRFGTIEDMKRLLASGASLEAVDDLGSYVIHEAVFYDRSDLVPFIIQSGADLFVENFSGFTPLHVALEQKNRVMVVSLLKLGAQSQLRPCGELLEMIQKDESFLMAQTMIEAGFDPNCRQSSLLFSVISSTYLTQKGQKLATLEYLFDHNIRTQVVSVDLGDTPLMRAAAVGDARVVEALIDYGVDLFATDRFGRTALDYDSLYLDQVNPKIALLLKNAGLNTGIKVVADQAFEEAEKLYRSKSYLEAFKQFEKEAKKFKQKRFYEGMLKSGIKVEKLSIDHIQILIETYTHLHTQQDEAFFTTLINYYEKMLPLCSNEMQLDLYGNYKSDSVYYVYEKIDRLYDKLYLLTPKIGVLYKKYQNLKRFKSLITFKRIDKSYKEGRYVGESLQGKPFGKGMITYKNGSKYIGEQFHLVRHGKGKMTYSDNTIYDGLWKDDKREGRGFFTDKKNILYIGNFIRDILQGNPVAVRH